MSSQQNVFIVTRNLILQVVDQIAFLPTNIKQGFLPPSGGNFISFVALPSEKTSIRGYNSYDSNNNQATNHLLYNNLMQIDYYSDFEYHASDEARKMEQYLSSFAQEYLTDNYNNYSLGVIYNIENLTDWGDKAKYLYRYCLRFELFSHEFLTVAQTFIDDLVITPKVIL